MGKGKWRTILSEIVHNNDWFSVYRKEVITPHGIPKTHYGMKTLAAVNVVPYTEKEEIVLVQQSRLGTEEHQSCMGEHDSLFETPGGGLDGLDPLVAARKELLEETGYEATDIVLLGKRGISFPLPGMTDKQTHMFFATGLRQTGRNQQIEDGIERMQHVPIREAFNLIWEGHIVDASSVTAIALAGIRLGMLPGR